MRFVLRIGLAVAAAAALAPPAAAKERDETVVAGELGRKLDAAVLRAGGADFWGSVLVARDGEPLLAKGYGFADYAKTPNTPRTLFELASASKQVAAVAVLRLEQEGRLSVADPLERFFDGVPEDKRGITLHQLLTHTSGISGEVGVPYASTLPRGRWVETVLEPKLASEPGTRFEYCNVGYALLAAVVEEVTKGSFEGFCEKALFRPAALADTGFIGDRDLARSGRCSTRRTEEPGDFTAADWHWGWGYRGMGGVVTSVLDLLRWDRALRGDRILAEPAREKLFTPALEGYACGFRVETTDRGTRKAHHGGSVRGYGTNLVRWLDEDACLFVLSNDPRKAYEVSGALEELLFEPVKISAVVDAGDYRLGEYGQALLPRTAHWEADRRGGKLRLRLRDGRHTAMELMAPAAYAARLAADLEQAIAARLGDDPGEPAAVEAGLYLGAYPPGLRKHELEAGLRVSIRPEYRGQDRDGNPVVDRRVLFVLEDGARGQWPVMVKMNVAAARALLAALRDAR